MKINLLLQAHVNIYRPQTKLQEGDVFTAICLLTEVGGGVKSNASWDRSHGRLPPPLGH